MHRIYLYALLIGLGVFAVWIQYNIIKRHLPDGMTFLEFIVAGDKIRYVK